MHRVNSDCISCEYLDMADIVVIFYGGIIPRVSDERKERRFDDGTSDQT